ncbi:MAG: tetratricopeptide repeat-containing sensor histidine kinase [Cyclobacteriaceae bacterium]|nr:tetratricopeptide repeat-containing sensor histidine kinase [Cyclobacteriaceae bacterium]
MRGLERIDSLENIARGLSGEAKVDMLNSMALECSAFDERKSNEYTLQALEISEGIGYKRGKALSLIYRALYEQSLGDQLLAGKFYAQGVSQAHQTNLKNIEGYGLVKYANFLARRGEVDSASMLFTRAHEVLNGTEFLFEFSVLNKEWSRFYGLQGQRDKQLQLLKKSLALRESLNRPNLLADIYLQFADYHIEMLQYDSAESFLRQTNYINTLKLHSPDIANEYKLRKANLHLRKLEYEEALRLLNEIKLYYRSNGLMYEYVVTQVEIAYTFSDLGNYELSLNNAYEGLKIAETNGYSYEQSRLLWQLGWVYFLLSQNDLGKDFAFKSFPIAVRNRYKVLEGLNYNLLGIIYSNTKVYDSSLYYLNKAFEVRKSIKDKTRMASTLNNMGHLMSLQGKFSESIAYQLQSLALETEAKNDIGIVWCNLSLGQVYIKLKDYARASEHLKVAEALAQKSNFTQSLRDIYREKATLASLMGNSEKSAGYYKLYIQLSDSLYSSSLANRIASLQSEYTLLQKNQQIELLNKDKELRDAALLISESRLRQQRIAIAFGLAILLFTLVAGFIVYRNYKKVRSLNFHIQEQNEEIQAQSEELQLSNHTILRINEELESTVELRTRELKQAYKELDTFFYRSSHDFRRPLTTFMGLAEVAKVTIKDENAVSLFEKVNQTARSLDKMLIKLQSVSDVGSAELIYKEIYMDEVFVTAQENLSSEIKNHEIRVTTNVASAYSFYSYPALIRVIVENLLENSIMFSYPGSVVNLSASADGKGLTLIVEDQGWGIEEQYIDKVFDMYFRANERSKGNGLGLYIVKKVVDKLMGKVKLSSTFQLGTSVEIFLPHRSKATASA